RRALGSAAALLVVVLAGCLHSAGNGPGWPRYEPDDDTGRDTGTASFRPQDPLAIEAAFAHESYAPGSDATLRFFSTLAGTRVRIFAVGAERTPTIGDMEMRGVPVAKPRILGRIRRGEQISMHIGSWKSGLYFAELTGPRGHVGYAP